MLVIDTSIISSYNIHYKGSYPSNLQGLAWNLSVIHLDSNLTDTLVPKLS